MKNLPNLRVENIIVDRFIKLGYFVILLTMLLNLDVFLSFKTQNEVEVEAQAAQQKPKKPVAKTVDAKQLNCLAKNIYYEAGSEPATGKAAVARVTMNRVNHSSFASTPCAVVYQANMVSSETEEGDKKTVKLCQFSWVCENVKKINPHDPRYKESEKIAYEVLAYDAYKHVVPSTTLFFHSVFVQPNWPYKQVKKIGNHIFYSREPKTRKKAQHTNLAKA